MKESRSDLQLPSNSVVLKFVLFASIPIKASIPPSAWHQPTISPSGLGQQQHVILSCGPSWGSRPRLL